jgi:hypothetical protein
VTRNLVDLPFWIVYSVVTYWFLTIPAAIVLMLIGWYGDSWLHGLRSAVFAAAALLVAPFPIAAASIIIDQIKSSSNLAALQRTLDRDETIAGLELPAGSKIYFTDKTHTGISAIDLPAAAHILGKHVVGTLDWSLDGHVWTGSLAGDQHLDGWPCRAGPVEFDNDGTVQECTLATAHEMLGLALPAGTLVTRGRDDKPWALHLPEDAGLALPALATMAPHGATVFVTSHGRVERISSGDSRTIVVRGVPLDSMSLYARGDQVVAALAVPFMVAGEMRPAGTGVRIDLPTGGVALAARNWWLSE